MPLTGKKTGHFLDRHAGQVGILRLPFPQSLGQQGPAARPWLSSRSSAETRHVEQTTTHGPLSTARNIRMRSCKVQKIDSFGHGHVPSA
jgi:hypothetical protein